MTSGWVGAPKMSQMLMPGSIKDSVSIPIPLHRMNIYIKHK